MKKRYLYILGGLLVLLFLYQYYLSLKVPLVGREVFINDKTYTYISGFQEEDFILANEVGGGLSKIAWIDDQEYLASTSGGRFGIYTTVDDGSRHLRHILSSKAYRQSKEDFENLNICYEIYQKLETMMTSDDFESLKADILKLPIYKSTAILNDQLDLVYLTESGDIKSFDILLRNIYQEGRLSQKVMTSLESNDFTFHAIRNYYFFFTDHQLIEYNSYSKNTYKTNVDQHIRVKPSGNIGLVPYTEEQLEEVNYEIDYYDNYIYDVTSHRFRLVRFEELFEAKDYMIYDNIFYARNVDDVNWTSDNLSIINGDNSFTINPTNDERLFVSSVKKSVDGREFAIGNDRHNLYDVTKGKPIKNISNYPIFNFDVSEHGAVYNVGLPVNKDELLTYVSYPRTIYIDFSSNSYHEFPSNQLSYHNVLLDDFLVKQNGNRIEILKTPTCDLVKAMTLSDITGDEYTLDQRLELEGFKYQDKLYLILKIKKDSKFYILNLQDFSIHKELNGSNFIADLEGTIYYTNGEDIKSYHMDSSQINKLTSVEEPIDLLLLKNSLIIISKGQKSKINIWEYPLQ